MSTGIPNIISKQAFRKEKVLEFAEAPRESGMTTALAASSVACANRGLQGRAVQAFLYGPILLSAGIVAAVAITYLGTALAAILSLYAGLSIALQVLIPALLVGAPFGGEWLVLAYRQFLRRSIEADPLFQMLKAQMAAQSS